MQRSTYMRYAVLPALSATTIAASLFGLPSLMNAHAQTLRRLITMRRHEPPIVNKKDFEVSPLETRVLGQSRWLRGGPAALRVIVADHKTGRPLRARVTCPWSAWTTASLRERRGLCLLAGQTASAHWMRGSTRPAGAVGPYQLTVHVRRRPAMTRWRSRLTWPRATSCC